MLSICQPASWTWWRGSGRLEDFNLPPSTPKETPGISCRVWEKRLMLNQRAEQTYLKVKTQLLSEHFSKHTVCCLMWIRQSAMSSRSLAQLSPLVVAPTADNVPGSTRVEPFVWLRLRKHWQFVLITPMLGLLAGLRMWKLALTHHPAKQGSKSHDMSSLHLRKIK